MDKILLVPILVPIAAGIGLLCLSFREHLYRAQVCGDSGVGARPERSYDSGKSGKSVLHAFFMTVLSFSAAAALYLAWTKDRSLKLFMLLEDIPVLFHVDQMGRLFVTLFSVIWLLTGVYSLKYMEHEGEEKRYFGFYLILYGVLTALAFAGNLVTFYLCYEFVTIVSFPLVMHSGTKESIMAALKYLFYSMCGAYGGLFGISFLNRYCVSLDFVPGGQLGASAQGHEWILLIAVFVMLIGFGAKAGMLPLHAWLPSAHPVAPSPASAVLSAIIVKAGVLAVIRVVYYVAGPEFLRGTWVQYAWMALSLATVFMGSLLAYREKGFKKRLAYSTVSQVSYILFGLSLLTPLGITGALLHVTAHGVIKCGLFLTAGIFLYKFGYTQVEELAGIGKRMPAALWCYTIFSLGLIGIPPTAGFISKWYLAQGALEQGLGFGPVVLLLSALLTAGYLLPIVMKGFFPGEAFQGQDLKREEPPLSMLVPLVLLAVLTVLIGLFPNPLTGVIREIAESVWSR